MWRWAMKRLFLQSVLLIFCISGCASTPESRARMQYFFDSLAKIAATTANPNTEAGSSMHTLAQQRLLDTANRQWASQYTELDQAYQAGEMTYPEYLQARQNLQAQELQWRNNVVQAAQESNRQKLMQQQIINQRMRSLSPINTNCYQIGNQISCQSN